MDIQSYLPDDNYKPLVSKPSLQQYDNYQLYSLILVDYPYTSEYFEKILDTTGYSSQTNSSLSGMSTKDFKVISPYVVGENDNFAGKMLAYQQFDANGKIPVDFRKIAEACYLKPRNSYNYRTGVITPKPGSSVAGYIVQNGFDPVLIPNYDSSKESEIRNEVAAANTTYSNPQLFLQDYSFQYFTGMSGGYRAYYYKSVAIMQAFYGGESVTVPIPDFISLATTYPLDIRQRPPNLPSIMSTLSGALQLSYYRKNGLEGIDEITSLDWMVYKLELTAGIKCFLPIINPTFGTLVINGDPSLVTEIKSKLNSIVLPANSYTYDHYYFKGNGLPPSIWTEWEALYNAQYMPARPSMSSEIIYISYAEYHQPIIRVLSANNNCWNNDTNTYSDLNYLSSHPLYLINSYKSNRRHIEPQYDSDYTSYGRLIMDSPRTIEIHKALDAGKYALNSLDATKPRVTNIGHLVEKAAFLLGYRPDDNGKVDRVKERDEIVRKQIDKRDPSVVKSIQDGDYSPACFAEKGMVIKRLPNEIRNGRIVEGQVEKVHDIPQVLASILDQLNESLGIQEGSNIQLPLSNKGKAVYPNQLALLLDMARTLAEINEYTRSTRITAMVTHQQVGEILAATGLEPIAKFIEVSSDGKTTAQIPYWGIHPKESLRTSIDNVTANVGILLGQIGV